MDAVADGSKFEYQIPSFDFLMELDSQEYIDQAIYKGHFEPVTTDWISSHLAPGDVFVDVGANIGYFTLIGATRVGPQGRVIAVEPTTFAMAKLQRNIVLNSLSNVSFYKYALSREIRYAVDISYEPDQYLQGTDHSLRSSWRMDDGTVGSVQLGQKDFCDHIPLDDLCRRDGFDVVNMIKIDVDGNEIDVLAGAHETIVRSRPTMIVELLDPSRSKTRFEAESGLTQLRQQMNFIFDQGYSALAEDGQSLISTEDIISLLKSLDGKSGAPNFLFLPK